MNRNESIQLFKECETTRLAVRKEALAANKSLTEAEKVAHEAAKTVWNKWANDMLTQRKQLEDTGAWATEKDQQGKLVANNDATSKWMHDAAVDFSSYEFWHDECDEKDIHFAGYVFPGDARFDKATFKGIARFAKTDFHGNTTFPEAKFHGAEFSEAKFHESTVFDEAKFHGVQFFGAVKFKGVNFFGKTLFRGVKFHGTARFNGVLYYNDVSFERARFYFSAFFDHAKFKNNTSFFLVQFEQYARFDTARFYQEVNFAAIRSRRGFSLADAIFDGVPNFIQAHFEEAPRLDNIKVLPTKAGGKGSRRLRANIAKKVCVCKIIHGVCLRRVDKRRSSYPARFRALRRLAIQGHDPDRTLEFFGREIKANRLVSDWPLPKAIFWRPKNWAGVARFWFGLGYQCFGGLGVSWFRPLLCWFLTIIVAAAFYFGESPDNKAERKAFQREGHSKLSSYWHVIPIVQENSRSCYAPKMEAANNSTHVGALAPEVRDKTNTFTEALHLAFHNALIIFDGGTDAMHRTYGCLYGVELYGGSNPVAVVPSSVTKISAIQKLFSAVFIFLFVLAIRNMLKMK